jgi:hypothetical protein
MAEQRFEFNHEAKGLPDALGIDKSRGEILENIIKEQQKLFKDRKSFYPTEVLETILNVCNSAVQPPLTEYEIVFVAGAAGFITAQIVSPFFY